MIEHIPADWREALADAISGSRFAHLTDFVAAERARTDTAVFPAETDVFNALRLTPLAEVKAVILGQDPYHGVGQAHGLAFSCLTTPLPPSLRNIFTEWQRDLVRSDRPASGSLEPWARKGVLLLNALLTVRRNEPNSHRREGWEDFTGAVIRAVAAKRESVAFLLWGRKAAKIAGPIAEPHFGVVASHPSPFSVGGFRSTSPFTIANEGLVHRGRRPIDWDLPTSR